jgi:predicted amidohydrolase YtcJ
MMLESQEDLYEQGITAVQSDDVKYAPEGRAYEMLEELKKASLDGRLKVHYAEQALSQTKAEVDDWFSHEHYKMRDGSFKVSCLKVLSDGSLGARTAFLKKPYADDSSTSGIQIYTQEELDYFALEAQNRNIPVAIHAIGDGAMEMCLNAIENAKNAYPEYSPRHAIVHCQITDAPLVERFAKNRIAALVQPIFLHYDMHIAEDRVGKQLASTSYAFGAMDKLGIHCSYGTDSPVEDLNAMENIYCAVTHKDLSGFPEGGWMPNEIVSVEAAVDHYTVDGAWNSFEENIKGRLKPGYYADLAVLSDDIFIVCPESIKDVKVEMTVMNGKIVYKA